MHGNLAGLVVWRPVDVMAVQGQRFEIVWAQAVCAPQRRIVALETSVVAGWLVGT